MPITHTRVTIDPPATSKTVAWIKIILGIFLIITSVAASFYLVFMQHDRWLLASCFVTAISTFIQADGRQALYTPRRFMVNETGVTIVDRSGQEQLHPWSQLIWYEYANDPWSTCAAVRFYAPSGALALKLPTTLANRHLILPVVHLYALPKPNTVPTLTQAQENFRRSGKKACIWGGLGLVLFTAITAFACYRTYLNWQFERDAVPGDAVVTERYLAPNGTTTRIRVKILGYNNTEGSDHFEVSPEIWDTLKIGDTFPVDYVPANPSNLKPVDPGVDPRPGPPTQPMIFMGLLLMAVTFYYLLSGIKALRTPVLPAPAQNQPNPVHQTPTS